MQDYPLDFAIKEQGFWHFIDWWVSLLLDWLYEEFYNLGTKKSMT